MRRRRKDKAGTSLLAVSGSVNRGKLVKAGLIAAGMAAVTAGSAAVSSMRRRTETNES